jgi:transcriptional regulator with XRE-family HTH domain
MIGLITPSKAQEALAENVRARRIAMGLTQAGLSKRSGVALATLRKFEQTGMVSLDSLLKLMFVVGGLENMVKASAPEQTAFSSIDEVLADDKKPARKRGYRS